MPVLKLSQIAGFDFDKKTALIKTGRTYTDQIGRVHLVHEVEPISDDEIQAIFDAWQRQKSINESYGFK
jgi:hypothetical protein